MRSVQLVLFLILAPLTLVAAALPEKEGCVQAHEAENKEENQEGNKDEENQKEPDKKEEKKDKPNKDEEKQKEEKESPKFGNLAFPTSQQPSPLASFGQNIIDKGQWQFVLFSSYLKGNDQYYITLTPQLLYQPTDELSILLFQPFAVRYREKEDHTTAPGDGLVQLEYMFYQEDTDDYLIQATVLGNITLPTGSARKHPPTGFGANSFFLGATWDKLTVDWYYFFQAGWTFTTSSHQTKYGNQFLYQAGIGRRIASTKEWLFNWLVEFDGTHYQQDRLQGKINPNSGADVFYITPSLSLASIKHLVLQLGIGFPVYQHLRGKQTKNDYVVESNFIWTF